MTSSKQDNVVDLVTKPQIVSRDQHTVSRKHISESALKVLYRLHNAGYEAYLVGGAVRDLLLGIVPKDFDVVTNAHPEQVRELFRNSRIIGRRFRLVHVRYGREIIEVSTFRAAHHVSDVADTHTEDGRILRDNVYGQIDDDVWRRDFTTNALFYNVADFSIVDYVNGIKDIEAKQLRLIGDPLQRYVEDPVRMLRAVRFSVKLGFTIHGDTEKPIKANAHLLEDISPARLFEECLKLFMSGQAFETLHALRQQDLFKYLFPLADKLFAQNTDSNYTRLIELACRNTDKRIAEGKPVTPGFLLAAMLWGTMREQADVSMSHSMHEMDAIHLAADTVFSKQVTASAFPRRLTKIAKEVWELQPRLKKGTGKKNVRLLSHPRFRAAYDFLLLRGETGEEVQEQIDWWTQKQKEFPELLEKRVSDKSGMPQAKRHNSKRRKRKPHN